MIASPCSSYLQANSVRALLSGSVFWVPLFPAAFLCRDCFFSVETLGWDKNDRNYSLNVAVEI
jgi:hypothetical protein